MKRPTHVPSSPPAKALLLALFAACGDGTSSGPLAPRAPRAASPAQLDDDSICVAPEAGGPPPSAPDPGRIGIHRLSNAEYDATARDLLGVTSTPAVTGFIPDEMSLGFDTIAAALGVTDAQFEQYFDAADALAEQAFADPVLKAGILTCGVEPDEAACRLQIIKTFGLRAWRRPLKPLESDSLVRVALEARDQGETFEGSMLQVVKVMLAAPQFLFRIEEDANPCSAMPHPVDDYSMASRLSYLLWGTMPDAELFAAASRGELGTDEGLASQLDRMLASPRVGALLTTFGGHWLGLADFATHRVETAAFDYVWDEGLRLAMDTEGRLWFRELFDGELSIRSFFTADVNFVNSQLGIHYGMGAPPPGTESVRVEIPMDHRVGFLGLGHFLTNSSLSYRTSPTLRGRWVLENLLCQSLPPPPPGVPLLDPDGQKQPDALPDLQSVRPRLEQHRRDPACAGCHRILDPIGLGLEQFDGVGRYHQYYAHAVPVDATGELPDGTTFDGLEELAALLAQDPRLAECASQKLMTYALSRELQDSDVPYLDDIRSRWLTGDGKLRTLLVEIVESAPFRQRRGEVAP